MPTGEIAAVCVLYRRIQMTIMERYYAGKDMLDCEEITSFYSCLYHIIFLDRSYPWNFERYGEK